jgi:hypothetical protein
MVALLVVAWVLASKNCFASVEYLDTANICFQEAVLQGLVYSMQLVDLLDCCRTNRAYKVGQGSFGVGRFSVELHIAYY